MRRLLVCAFLVLAGLVLLASAASARVAFVAPPPGPARTVLADAIVVGRVVGMEDKDIEVAPFPGSPAKASYRIAIVAVTDGVKGARDLKMIRVGFPAPPMGVNDPNPGIRPIRPRPGMRVELKVGTEGLLYLTKSAEKNLFLMPNYYDLVAREGGNFKKEVEDARKYGQLLDNPMEGLKAKDTEQRFLTAGLLVTRYRTNRAGQAKTEPISAEESKLILTALAEANWDRPQRFGELHPMNMFSQLGLTAKDGWQPPQQIRNISELHNAAERALRPYVIWRKISFFSQS
ncbi:MAG: hypothetical protein L0Z62_06115, partial [Gemmataceae bacterium]|nr:hypothetical protein [Gemmataceae bacterium]